MVLVFSSFLRKTSGKDRRGNSLDSFSCTALFFGGVFHRWYPLGIANSCWECCDGRKKIQSQNVHWLPLDYTPWILDLCDLGPFWWLLNLTIIKCFYNMMRKLYYRCLNGLILKWKYWRRNEETFSGTIKYQGSKIHLPLTIMLEYPKAKL